jgi:hypothetical protein
MATRSEIDMLRLAPRAKAGAVLLNEMFPDTVFTSGLRDILKQSVAMARNVARNPKWIGETYKHGQELQELLDRAQLKGQATVQQAIYGYLSGKSEEWLARFSRHFAGYAFDVLPVADVTGIPTVVGHKMIELMRFGIGAEKVLLREGGQVVWHVQFTPTEEV